MSNNGLRSKAHGDRHRHRISDTSRRSRGGPAKKCGKKLMVHTLRLASDFGGKLASDFGVVSYNYWRPLTAGRAPHGPPSFTQGCSIAQSVHWSRIDALPLSCVTSFLPPASLPSAIVAHDHDDDREADRPSLPPPPPLPPCRPTAPPPPPSRPPLPTSAPSSICSRFRLLSVCFVFFFVQRLWSMLFWLHVSFADDGGAVCVCVRAACCAALSSLSLVFSRSRSSPLSVPVSHFYDTTYHFFSPKNRVVGNRVARRNRLFLCKYLHTILFRVFLSRLFRHRCNLFCRASSLQNRVLFRARCGGLRCRFHPNLLHSVVVSHVVRL